MGPPKPKAESADTGPMIDQFKAFGLSQAKAAEAAKTPKSAGILTTLLEDPSYGLKGITLEEKQAVLVAAFAVQLSKTDIGVDERTYILRAVESGRLKTVDQVTAATKYLESHSAPIDDTAFDQECGVGFSITPEALSSLVSEYISSGVETLTGWANLGKTISGVKGTPGLRWADPLEIKNAVESAFISRFGAKEAAKPKGKEPKKELKAEVQKPEELSVEAVSEKVFTEGFLGALHKPGGNAQCRPELMEKHLAFTQGHVFTRFPPEPNGFLHIGHCKAIFVDFGYAKFHGGKTYLRYDDTNPEAEEGRYFESILETVRWLGFEPWKITYSSDYFDQLHALAIELIRRDKAYVCHCTDEELKANRGERKAAPRACTHRDRPVTESVAEFDKMKNGGYQPGQAILRMKQDLADGNPYMWDLVAYRVLLAPHHRTGSKWRIYPTYDFTHCLVDSFENISHSLCTTEFIAARQSYEWLCDALEVYKPRQSEFGRLNITGTVMSKRKIKALVEESHVRAWDDPRLYTLIALRRRGVPPGAILSFVSTLGVSTSPSTTQVARFEQAVRQHLENTAPRLLMVLRPLRVVLENVSDDYLVMCEKPLHPKVPALGLSKVPFTKILYIDRDDFRTEDAKDYFRLAPGKTVGLFQAPHPVTCVSFTTDAAGEVAELVCRLEDGGGKKPKAFIQWVGDHAASGSPVRIDETRIFHPLFTSDNPAAADDFRADLNPRSEEVVRGALVEVGFWPLARGLYAEALRESRTRTERARRENPGASGSQREGDNDTPVATAEQLIGKEVVRFQGLRVAYFALDSDAKIGSLEDKVNNPGHREGDYIVLNRIVSLKEDAGKAV